MASERVKYLVELVCWFGIAVLCGTTITYIIITGWRGE